jgi:hypothetical protein
VKIQPEIERADNKNPRLKPTGLANPGNTCMLMGTGMGLDHKEAASQVFGQFQNQR